MSEEYETEVFVEVPGGSRNKYEFDKERGVFELDRILYSPMHYPGDYGFVPDTLARDGDALDALIILGEPTFPGCHVRSRVVGVMEMEDEAGPDETLLCVPVNDPRWNEIQTLDDVPSHVIEEITHFFNIYKDLEPKHSEVNGWSDRDQGMQYIKDSQERYKNEGKG